MPLREHFFRPFYLKSILVLAVTAGVIVSLGRGASTHDATPDESAGVAQFQAAAPTMPELAAVPPGTPAPTVEPTPEPTEPATSAVPTSDELRHLQPNELGMVPILEYHMITTDPAEEAQFVRLADKMRADLQWLYEHNFYIVPLRDVFNNTIQVPAGKHPVALTFDDATSTQFSFLLDDHGNLVVDEQGDPIPDPDTAVGILEAFYAEHPDFGRGGHFAPLIFNGFANPDEAQEPYFEQKLHWLVERGYEIGNHTKQHNDLYDLPTEVFVEMVAEPIAYMDKVLGDIPENQARILTLPYGNSPDHEKHPDQRKMMREGIPYEGEVYHLTGALLVGADPAPSPASTAWDPIWTPRIQAFDESLEFWFGLFESGDVILYTSDGDPDTITVPDPLHPALEEQLDIPAVASTGKTVVRYDAETGEIVSVVGPGDELAAVDRSRPRADAGSGSGS